ncbi:BMC domain-containing protein [Ignavigranum ruoffiae]|uniref:BMC domain-containing protein n=1 Tax=Ignavigranum ruoffiae TaxID=89093 RepID=A0A1H9GIR4_9LACT|nr:BMC domain-containing protein [Ignavigranum ruoffiae]SEQ49967.1 BMC domain-containing protein [Ignavigranum ruoffiae]
MSSNALGMVEVRGLLASIIAADTAVKSANVHLIDNQTIRGGLTSVELFGDVGAIREAIESAKKAVSEMDCYVSSNVIANLDPQVEEMLIKSIEKKNKKYNQKNLQDESKQTGSSANEKEKKSDIEADSKNQLKIENSRLTSTTVYSNHDSSNEGDIETFEKDTTDLKENNNIIVEQYLEKIEKNKLSELKVTELRSLAYKMELKKMSKADIKFAKKDELIKAILNEGVE